VFPFTSFSRESRELKVKSPLHGGLCLRLRLFLVYLCKGYGLAVLDALDGAEFDRIPGTSGAERAAAGEVGMIPSKVTLEGEHARPEAPWLLYT
jgi:hypothetical protein